MIVTSYDVTMLRQLQMSQRKPSEVFAGIRGQFYFCFITSETHDNVCGLDGFLLDVRKHPTDNTILFIDFAVASHVEDFYTSYENIEVKRLYTNDKRMEQIFGFIFAQADKAEIIIENCAVENNPYLFLEEQT